MLKLSKSEYKNNIFDKFQNLKKTSKILKKFKYLGHVKFSQTVKKSTVLTQSKVPRHSKNF